MYQEKVPSIETTSAHTCQFCQHQTHDQRLIYFWWEVGRREYWLYMALKKKHKKPSNVGGLGRCPSCTRAATSPIWFLFFFFFPFLPFLFPTPLIQPYLWKPHSCTKLNVSVKAGECGSKAKEHKDTSLLNSESWEGSVRKWKSAIRF